MPTSETHVVFDGDRRFDLESLDALWFGREGDASGLVGLDPGDLGISRIAGSIQQVDGQWCLTNRSGSVPLYLDLEPGHAMQRLLPGQHHVLAGPLVVVVKGLRKMHRIDIFASPRNAVAATVGVGGDTLVGVSGLELTEGELDALTAIFQGFLMPFPRQNCIPLTYAEAGACLGLPGSTVRKRIEKVRTKLADLGIYVEGAQARWILADLVLDAAIITDADLTRLRSRGSSQDSGA